MPRPFHLGWFLQGSSVQAWGEPFTGAIGRDWRQPELFCDMARQLGAIELGDQPVLVGRVEQSRRM